MASISKPICFGSAPNSNNSLATPNLYRYCACLKVAMVSSSRSNKVLGSSMSFGLAELSKSNADRPCASFACMSAPCCNNKPMISSEHPNLRAQHKEGPNLLSKNGYCAAKGSCSAFLTRAMDRECNAFNNGHVGALRKGGGVVSPALGNFAFVGVAAS